MSDTLYRNRSEQIDYEQIPRLFFLGEYIRELPISIARMMENAYDWEHLPYIHASTFESIEKIDAGHWGWRCRVVLRSDSGARLNQGADMVGAGNQSQVQDVELLVDRSRNYWATTVIAGIGAGIQIHTGAVALAGRQTEVSVRFYLPAHFGRQLRILSALKSVLPYGAYKFLAGKAGLNHMRDDLTPAQSLFEILKRQYTLLYDEDLGLMNGRQIALDRRKQSIDSRIVKVYVSSVDYLKEYAPQVVQFGKERFCINFWKGNWVVYSADCPHLLGPLEKSSIDDYGVVTCPWHGYRFNIATGESCDGRTMPLSSPPEIFIEHGRLFLVPKHNATDRKSAP